jgi:hypothetical protein
MFMANARFDALTREHVIRAAQRVEPNGIRKWSAEVGGTEYPVKRLLMEAANIVESSAPLVTPADFIAHYAVRKLKKLGFLVHYYQSGT